jgi:hypothetical protein
LAIIPIQVEEATAVVVEDINKDLMGNTNNPTNNNNNNTAQEMSRAVVKELTTRL